MGIPITDRHDPFRILDVWDGLWLNKKMIGLHDPIIFVVYTTGLM